MKNFLAFVGSVPGDIREEAAEAVSKLVVNLPEVTHVSSWS
jgi:hypothetical protein